VESKKGDRTDHVIRWEKYRLRVRRTEDRKTGKSVDSQMPETETKKVLEEKAGKDIMFTNAYYVLVAKLFFLCGG
jgi:hypothetical protein